MRKMQFTKIATKMKCLKTHHLYREEGSVATGVGAALEIATTRATFAEHGVETVGIVVVLFELDHNHAKLVDIGHATEGRMDVGLLLHTRNRFSRPSA